MKPGDILARLDAANAAPGVTRTTQSEPVNGKRGISPEMAVQLSKVFGGCAESWLTQPAHYDLAHVRTDRIKLKRLELAEHPFRRAKRGCPKPATDRNDP